MGDLSLALIWSKEWDLGCLIFHLLLLFVTFCFPCLQPQLRAEHSVPGTTQGQAGDARAGATHPKAVEQRRGCRDAGAGSFGDSFGLDSIPEISMGSVSWRGNFELETKGVKGLREEEIQAGILTPMRW